MQNDDVEESVVLPHHFKKINQFSGSKISGNLETPRGSDDGNDPCLSVLFGQNIGLTSELFKFRFRTHISQFDCQKFFYSVYALEGKVQNLFNAIFVVSAAMPEIASNGRPLTRKCSPLINICFIYLLKHQQNSQLICMLSDLRKLLDSQG
jgi:hypothetical protein